jgi:rhodanese-related sulfurtransferase
MSINPVFIVTVLVISGIFFMAMRGVKQNSGFKNTDVKGFKEKMTEPDIVIVDVRTAAEVAEGAIKGAINIDVNSSGFKQKISELDKTKTYLVYCRSGARSARACNSLAGVGFTNVINLQGGYLAWAASK